MNTITTAPPVNAFLYDWLTVSFADVDFQDLIYVCGFDFDRFQEQSSGSRLHYRHRLSFDGVSVHYSDESDLRYCQGCCLELSGQGCRDFETFGHGDWQRLFDFISLAGGRITRLDIAYDDFIGVIDLDIMAAMAQKFYFTSRSQCVRIMSESKDGNPDHLGISVCHGSKSSDVYIRCYDKRVERNAYEYAHWVRFELQLRGDNTHGFVFASGGLGEKFCGVISNYLNYRCPDLADSNKRRWLIAPWWRKFLASAAALSINEKKDVQYNKDRLDMHVYDRNHNCIKTEILTDGLPAFLSRIFGHTEEMPAKYDKILRSSENAEQIQRIIGQTSPTGRLLDVAAGLEDFKNFHAFNDLER